MWNALGGGGGGGRNSKDQQQQEPSSHQPEEEEQLDEFAPLDEGGAEEKHASEVRSEEKKSPNAQEIDHDENNNINDTKMTTTPKSIISGGGSSWSLFGGTPTTDTIGSAHSKKGDSPETSSMHHDDEDNDSTKNSNDHHHDDVANDKKKKHHNRGNSWSLFGAASSSQQQQLSLLEDDSSLHSSTHSGGKHQQSQQQPSQPSRAVLRLAARESAQKDEQIAALQRSRLLDRTTLESVKRELTELKVQHKKLLHGHKVELEAARLEARQLQERLDGVLNELQDDTLQAELERLVQESAPSSLTSTTTTTEEQQQQRDEYIRHVQSKLAKALQRLSVMQNHNHRVKEMHAAYAKSMQEELVAVGEERVQMEVEYLNRLDHLAHEKKMSEQALLAKLELKQLRIVHLEETLEELESVGGSTSSSFLLEPERVEALVSVGALKEELAEMARAKQDVERGAMEKQRELEEEIEILKKANETKQKRIDQLQTYDALATLEKESEEMLFRERLVEHFDVMFERNEIVWSSRIGRN